MTKERWKKMQIWNLTKLRQKVGTGKTQSKLGDKIKSFKDINITILCLGLYMIITLSTFETIL